MRIALTFAAAFGALAAAPLASASNVDGTTLELSAQQNNQQQQQKKKAAPVQHQQRVQQHQQRVQHQQQFKPKQNVQQHHQQPKVIQQQKVQQQKFQQNNNKKTVIIKNNKPARQVTFSSNRQTFTGTRARAWHNRGRSNFRGRNYSYWRGGPWRHRYNGSWRTYVALGTLAAIAVGTATYYPYAYVEAPQDYCDGITEDGCQLSWTEVETEEGGLAPACVTYCPWQ
jgi:hypothetical protein